MSRLRLRVKEIAEEKGIDPTTLSYKAFMPVITIKAIYEDPYKNVFTDTLQKLAKALEVSIFDLMEEVPDEEQDKN
ncbi:XRE family transcriptional regulator [Ktedonosporobacter rubrisoli]|uniref:XRE family transcriptional regulator n=1 Tax=Ktedonosporobacter rubrisoli TaxID=2509675 RepID=A0A4V0YY93_KTERU|nr:helix-turn-helix transcriptional regulator [Ktedonosporobacter rubrisoli]QBD75421.1 XRE family transcriptional regulator [Ktedonosporobacter rubrisoli]